jgi:transposase InsO family protein
MCQAVVASCRSCLAYNIGRQGFHPIKSLQAPAVFGHIAVDTLGPLTRTPDGAAYVLIIVDVKTRYLITKPLPDHSMDTVARALFEVFSIFGPPAIMQSDNGTEYVNQLVEQLCNQAGVDPRKVAPFNPRAYGLAESYVKLVKTMLKKVLQGDWIDWDRALPPITSAINTREGKLSKTAPFTLFFARTMSPWADYQLGTLLGQERNKDLQEQLERLPDYKDVMEIQNIKNQSAAIRATVDPEIAHSVSKRQQALNELLDKRRKLVCRTLPPGATVFIANEHIVSKVDPLWVGPYTVVRRTQHKTYRLRDPDNEMLDKPIPISKIKWVSDTDITLFDNDGRPINKAEPRGVLKAILDTKKNEKGATMYLVNWKNPAEPSEWLEAAAFDDPAFLSDYWRKTRKATGPGKVTTKRKAAAAPEAKQPPAKRAKQAAAQEDLTGIELMVPAHWFGDDYAKETYKRKWKTAKEHAIVKDRVANWAKAKAKNKWRIWQPDRNKNVTYDMQASAIEAYKKR